MIELALDDGGWPVWPPQTPAIWESLQRVWSSGQWGKYESAIHTQCLDAVTEAMSISTASAQSLPPPWWAHGQRIQTPPTVRLCSSGTAAVELALRCCGITAGDEVVVAAYDYPGNFRGIELLGATPVLADVRSGGVTMDPQSLRQIDGEKIKAVVVSHLYGELADMLSIREICDQRNWKLIEDACQVPGAGWEVGHDAASHVVIPVGCLADCTTLSFGGSKLLSAGNGGAVLTREDRLAARLRSYADRPSDAFPLSALQCAALLPQWSMLDELNRRRRVMAARLRDWDWSPLNAEPLSANTLGQISAHYKFALLADETHSRAALLQRLRAMGLPVGEGFRSTHGTSERRSRKPVDLDDARNLGARCVVLDHRALLADDLLERLGTREHGVA